VQWNPRQGRGAACRGHGPGPDGRRIPARKELRAEGGRLAGRGGEVGAQPAAATDGAGPGGRSQCAVGGGPRRGSRSIGADPAGGGDGRGRRLGRRGSARREAEEPARRRRIPPGEVQEGGKGQLVDDTG